MNTSNITTRCTTKEKIYNALMYLLKRRKFDEIFVKDICTVACIHRSSFYEYYNDINDLMIQIENTLSKSIAKIFEGDHLIQKQSFIEFFSFIKEHSDFYNAYLNYEENKLMGRTDFIKHLKEQKKSQHLKDIEFHMAFFAGGLQAICNAWILSGMKKSPEQMADIITNEYKEKAKYFMN